MDRKDIVDVIIILAFVSGPWRKLKIMWNSLFNVYKKFIDDVLKHRFPA